MTRRFLRASPVRRACALSALAVCALAGAAAPALAEGPIPMKLFKIITIRDEVVVGLNDDELRSFGPKADLDNLANQIATAGQLTVWQYVVKKGDDGALRQTPGQRVAIFKTDTLRIEPYVSGLPVDPPKE